MAFLISSSHHQLSFTVMTAIQVNGNIHREGTVYSLVLSCPVLADPTASLLCDSFYLVFGLFLVPSFCSFLTFASLLPLPHDIFYSHPPPPPRCPYLSSPFSPRFFSHPPLPFPFIVLFLGSLSARVMSFWGDSPKGMVESAIEFAKICRKNDYHNFLFSMKVLWTRIT
jgi:GcpE protein